MIRKMAPISNLTWLGGWLRMTCTRTARVLTTNDENPRKRKMRTRRLMPTTTINVESTAAARG